MAPSHPLPFAAPPLPLRRVRHTHSACALSGARMRMAARGRQAVDERGARAVRVDDGLALADRLEGYAARGELPAHVARTLRGWAASYRAAMPASVHCAGADPAEFTDALFTTLAELARKEVAEPWPFESYHEGAREPFDYYRFGLDFATPLIDTTKSVVSGMENIREARTAVEAGENVVFMGNHQSEGDPYAIDVLFDWNAGLDRAFCENIIFMAGDRVRDDPCVAPFSIGRNLLTVYSKKHMHDVPSARSHKLRHNRRTLATIAHLFGGGGQALWFAPSGGRDRRDPDSGRIELSPFDPDAVDVIRMSAGKAGVPTRYYPMALVSHTLLPPVDAVGGATLGEVRTCTYAPMAMHVGEQVDWAKADAAADRAVADAAAAQEAEDAPPASEKALRRRARAQYVYDQVREAYIAIGGYDG